MMDSYRKLKLEFGGIKNVIEKYTGEGNVRNYLEKTGEALEKDDIETVLYCLEQLCIWYQENIAAILSNEFATNKDAHCRNKQLLEDIEKDLKDFNFDEITKKAYPTENLEEPKIFLSHRSSDKKFGDALEKFIIGLGVKNNQLIYTSHPLHKIPMDVNIYDYLRQNIHQKLFVIILWSNEYLESPACLNEMGAAWVTQSDYTSFYTPDFEFGNPKYHDCAVDTRKMGAVLKPDSHCKASMIEFKNKILDMFKLSIDEQSWTYLLEEFIKNIQ